MKTLREVCKEHGEFEKLIRAVIRRVGMDSVEDIANHGIDGEFNGFIYTRDTVKFFRQHRDDILKMAQQLADDLGEDMLSMIAGFNCLKDSKFTATEIGEAIFAGRGEYADTILNAMAWFAAEEVCRMFED